MIEFELENLNWKKRQLALRQKYADTPPGITEEQAVTEREHLRLVWEEYEEHHRFRLISGIEFEEEPFAGRKDELKELREKFTEGAGTVFLSGMGGIGKSALARAYGRCYAGEYDTVLLWNCEKNLERIFADDGQLGISNLVYAQGKYLSWRKYAFEKYERLAEIAKKEHLLIILDNYNEMEALWFERFLELPCDKLITTRLHSHFLKEQGYSVIPVEPLSKREDWEEFYRLYTEKTREKPEEESMIAYRDAVKGHTLKMKLALSNPEQMWTPEKLAKSILPNVRLKKSQIQILCELSYINLSGILEEVYLSCTEETKESLDSLKAYSMVQERKDSIGRNFLSLHPVILDAVKVTWQPNLTRCLKFIEKFAWYARFSWYRPREGDLWLVNQVFSLVDRLPKPVAWRYYPYECLATFFMEWEFFDEAEKIQLQLYKCVREYYGEEHQATAYMAFRIAGLYHDSMQFEKDKEWYVRSLQLYEAAKPLNHKFYHDKAEAAAKLERVYEYEGDYEAAHHCVDVAMKAMKNFQMETEEADPELWKLRRNRLQYIYMRRASIYCKQGKLDLAQEVLDKGLNLFPLDEFREVEIRRLQAHIYFAMGEYEKARDAAARDLEICIKYQGESYKMSMRCREILGDSLRAMGDIQAANENYLRVISLLQEKYPHQTVWMEKLREKVKM